VSSRWPQLAADEVCSSFRTSLLRRAKRLVRPGIEAEDLVQEVLADFLVRFRDEEISEAGAKAYLATSLRNLCLLRVRSMQVRRRAVDDPAMQVPEVPSPDEAEPSSSQVTDEELANALQGLSEKQKEVYLLHARGERYRDIAHALGLREGTVAKRVFDARQRLKSELLHSKSSKAEGR
jgi:RNA polymerase sigma-70 factor (ECF subfamily)